MLHIITFIFVCNIFLVIITILLMLFSTFRMHTSGNSLRRLQQHQKNPCMANPSLHNRLMQLHYHGVTESTRRTYQSELVAYTSFYSHFNINPLPAASLTLQYFCADKSQSISYQTLKVYLAATRLMHIKHGLPDPTVDQTLLLICRGIRRHQQITERKRLPITINILKLLKSYLLVSNYTVCE